MIVSHFLRAQQDEKMRLLVHNMMCCLKCESFPLKIEATEVENEEQDENKEFILNVLQRIDYDALKSAASNVCLFELVF